MIVEFIIKIAADTVRFAAYVLASLAVVVVGSWLVIALHLTYRGVAHAIQSEQSLWYHTGRASVYAQTAVRHPHLAMTALTTGVMVAEVTQAIESAIGDVSSGQSGNPPPEIAPIQADNLRMPTTYPFKRMRALPWPPFFGHHFALGERGV